MVVDSHTIIDPGAVVVKPFYALMTDRAVPGPSGSDAHAVGTKIGGLVGVQQLQEVDLGLLQVPGALR